MSECGRNVALFLIQRRNFTHVSSGKLLQHTNQVLHDFGLKSLSCLLLLEKNEKKNRGTCRLSLKRGRG